MRTNQLISPLFLTSVVLFLLHQVFQKMFEINMPVADAWLDNLVSMPILLTLLVAERRYLFGKGKHYRLNMPEMLLATAYVAMLSEIVFPLLSEKFIFDACDFLFFFSGTAIYYLFEKARNKVLNAGN